MKACLTTEEISPEEATQTAIKGEGVIGMDYVRRSSFNEKNLSLGPRGQIERAMVDPKIAGRTGKTSPATNPLPNCRIRLRDKGKYSAPALAEGLRGDRRPGRHIG